jgi:hypothetical protein
VRPTLVGRIASSKQRVSWFATHAADRGDVGERLRSKAHTGQEAARLNAANRSTQGVPVGLPARATWPERLAVPRLEVVQTESGSGESRVPSGHGESCGGRFAGTAVSALRGVGAVNRSAG